MLALVIWRHWWDGLAAGYAAPVSPTVTVRPLLAVTPIITH
jgi:hypothetical protein